MSKALCSGAAVALAVAGIAVTGCGKTVIDDSKTEDVIQQNLQQTLHHKIRDVDCPSDQEVDPGSRFDCDVTAANGVQATVTIKIVNDNADIAIVGFHRKSSGK